MTAHVRIVVAWTKYVAVAFSAGSLEIRQQYCRAPQLEWDFSANRSCRIYWSRGDLSQSCAKWLISCRPSCQFFLWLFLFPMTSSAPDAADIDFSHFRTVR